LQQYFPGKELATIKALSKPTRLEQQRIILQLFGYRACDSAAKEELKRKAQRIAMRSTQPIYILREALQYLAHQQVVIPGYTYLQDMVGRVVTGERKRITQLLSHALTPAVEERLAALLQSERHVSDQRAQA
jgi:hypothetical protein